MTPTGYGRPRELLQHKHEGLPASNVLFVSLQPQGSQEGKEHLFHQSSPPAEAPGHILSSLSVSRKNFRAEQRRAQVGITDVWDKETDGL